VIGGPLRGLLPEQQNGSFKTFAQAGGIHELEATRGSGQRFPVEATFSRMQVDEKWVGIAIVRDVTERKLQEAELERMALHDALTGLPNRTLLNDRIEQAIRNAQLRAIRWRCCCSISTASRTSTTHLATRWAICC
jgi:PAS domain-containing protein